MRAARLADIARVFNGNSISATEKDKHYRGVEGTPYIGTAEVGFDSEIDYDSGVAIPPSKRPAFKLAKAGTALVCAEGGSAGRKVGFLEREACFGNKLFAIEPNAGWDGKFIFYFSQSDGFRDQFRSLTTGLIGGVSIKKFKEIEVPSFKFEEQRRIVAALDEAFVAIAVATANAEKNLANARELFDSELDALVEDARAMFPGRPLADHCSRVTVGHVGPMKDRYRSVGIPFLRSQNVRPFQIELDGVAFIDEAFDAELVKSRLTPGDVAVVRTGYPGTAAVIPPSLPISNCADLVIVRPGADLNPYYVAAFLNSNLGKRMIAGNLVGAAQKHFNVGAAKKVAIPLPPLAEQKRFVARVDELREMSDQLVEVYELKLGKLTTLKQSLLHRAFSGDLTKREALAA